MRQRLGKAAVNASCLMLCRYERSGERLRTGRALVQRHVALPEDLANKEGKGLLVRSEPQSLGEKLLSGAVVVEPRSVSELSSV